MRKINPASIAGAVAALRNYDFGRPTDALAHIDECMQATAAQPEIRPVLEKELAKALAPDFTLAARQFACEKLWILGSDAAAPLLADPDARVAEAACCAIGRRASTKADEAVRTALGKARGKSLAAVIQLAGERRDPGSVAALAPHAALPGTVAALGKIASPEAIAALLQNKAQGRDDALLQAAQELERRGWCARSRELFARLQKEAGASWIRRGAASMLERMNQADMEFHPLFNGRDLSEFVVDTPALWSVRDGVIVGKSPGLPYNEFLRTRAAYENFVLRAGLRMIDGYGNSGFQFRSKPIANSHEVEGYQADAGQRYWGALYDESRRRKILAGPDNAFLDALDPAAWHAYVVHAEGNRIRISLDGVQTVDYVEAEAGIPRTGLIALQVHADKQPVEMWFRDLRIKIL